MGRRSALAVTAAMLTAMVVASSGAIASPSHESQFISLINAERSARGLSTVSVRSDLTAVARSWSDRMAAENRIWHDPDLPDRVSGWTALGDNVGRGGSVSAVHDAFMASDAHRSIIMDPRFNQVGVGVTEVGGVVYVTQVFVKRASAAKVVRTTTRAPSRRTTTTRQTQAGSARTAEYIVDMTGLVWEVDFGTRPVTVAVLEQLVGLDSARVDPATGIPV